MAPPKTRDRIVEASLELFNAQGERSVTTNHIAAHLGMSPGNLYYHFRNKQAIIALLFFGAYFLRKLNGGRSFGNNGPLRIVGGLMISARERIVLLEVGDEWIVIGIVPGQIKTLHTLPKGEIQAPGSSEKSFSQWLKHIGERKKNELE